VRYGSRSNTKMRTVKIKGSVRFALLTVILKNGNGRDRGKKRYCKKTENGTDMVRCGTVRTRCGTLSMDTGTVAVTNSDALLYYKKI
jgi:hypothetical protein